MVAKKYKYTNGNIFSKSKSVWSTAFLSSRSTGLTLSCDLNHLVAKCLHVLGFLRGFTATALFCLYFPLRIVGPISNITENKKRVRIRLLEADLPSKLIFSAFSVVPNIL